MAQTKMPKISIRMLWSYGGFRKCFECNEYSITFHSTAMNVIIKQDITTTTKSQKNKRNENLTFMLLSEGL